MINPNSKTSEWIAAEFFRFLNKNSRKFKDFQHKQWIPADKSVLIADVETMIKDFGLHLNESVMHYDLKIQLIKRLNSLRVEENNENTNFNPK